MACDSPAWAHGLTANNLNYEDVIEEEMLEKLLELHKRDTLVPLGPVPVAEQQQVKQLRYPEDKSRLVSNLSWTN